MQDLADIKKLRRKLGLTQEELAETASVSQSLIAKIESGKIQPAYNKVQQIMAALENAKTHQELTAKDFMVTTLQKCNSQDGVKKVIAKMKKHNISQLPVMEEKVLVGLVTETDLLEHVFDADVDELTANDVMQPAPPIITPGTPESAILPLLKHFPLIIVMENGKIKGGITKSDIIQTTW